MPKRRTPGFFERWLTDWRRFFAQQEDICRTAGEIRTISRQTHRAVKRHTTVLQELARHIRSGEVGKKPRAKKRRSR